MGNILPMFTSKLRGSEPVTSQSRASAGFGSLAPWIVAGEQANRANRANRVDHRLHHVGFSVFRLW